MRVLALLNGWTGFLDAQFRAFAELGADLIVVTPGTMKDTAFPEFADIEHAHMEFWEEPPTSDHILDLAREFRPDVCLMGPWTVRPYRQAMKQMPEAVLKLIAFDNLWYGTPKQWLGRLTSRWYLRNVYDAALVASDRTEHFASRLGFKPDQMLRGFYTADTHMFSSPPRSGEELASHRRFVVSMRLVEHKGTDILADAFEIYLSKARDPWELAVAGLGPLRHRLAGMPGIDVRGFVVPSDLAELMRSASCFVNPSRADPYGLAMHEATSVGLPIISSTMVGAVPGLVQDGVNGWLVGAGSANQLADAMLRMSELPSWRLEEMSQVSTNLASRLSPEKSARHLLEEFSRRLDVHPQVPSW